MQAYLSDKNKDFIDLLRDKHCSVEFAKEIARRLEPIWKDIYNYEYGGLWKRFWIRIKAFLRSRHGDCNVPHDVIETLASTFLPDIRAFFESEEGKKKFEEWKENQVKERNRNE